MRTTRARRWLPLALVPLSFLAHAPALTAGYVLDDRALLVDNPFLRNLSGLGRLLTSGLFEASADFRVTPYYRPLAGLVTFAAYQLVGASAPLQHALNLALHGLVAALLAAALTAAGVRRGPAFFAGLILLVHPATPEVAAYLAGRHDLLGWSCLLGGALAIARRAGQAPLLVLPAALATAGAALSREAFLTAPLLLLPWALRDRARLRPCLTTTALGGAVGLGLVLALRAVVGVPPPEPGGLGAVAAAIPPVAWRLVRVALLPNDVSVEVSIEPATGADLARAGLLLAGLAGAIAVTAARARPLLPVTLAGAVTILSAAVVHAPTAAQFGFIADRYAYGALIGVLLMATPLLEALWHAAAASPRPWLLQGLVPAFAVAMTPLTWARDAAWRDQESLQLAMVQARPDDPQTELALGVLLHVRGDPLAAEPHCAAYAAAKPASDRADYCRASARMARGDPAGAARLLERYVLARPSLVGPRLLRIRALLATGDLHAIEQLLPELEAATPDAPDLMAARAELARRRRDASAAAGSVPR